MAKFTL